MSYETIISATENLISELVLSDPDEANSLRGLLPLLKRVHTLCNKAALKAEARTILKAKQLIDSILKSGPQANGSLFSDLEATLSDFSDKIKGLDSEEPDGEAEIETVQQTGEGGNHDEFTELEIKLNELSMRIAGFCPSEIPDLGAMLNNLDDLINISKGIDPSTFYDISALCKKYVETMTLESMNNTGPVEEGVLLLKSVLSYLKRGEPFTFDYSDVLEMLEENLSREGC